MKTRLKLPIFSICFGSLLVAGFAGTISGSLAWWAYSTRATVSYQGTSVASSEQLQIGLHTEVDLTSFGMKKELIGDDDPTTEQVKENVYYFCDAGAGLPAEAIAYYLTHNGEHHAVDELEPITTREYTSGDLSLYNPLVSGSVVNNNPADDDKYVHIALAFRVLRYHDGVTPVAEKGENIWLSDAVVEASGEKANETEVQKAIRIFTVGKYNNGTSMEEVKYLINPSDDSEDPGQTAVSGCLDLSGDGYYDTYTKGGKDYAIVYGDHTNTITESSYEDEPWGDNDDLVDFNKVYPENTDPSAMEKSTFVASYTSRTYYLDSLDTIGPKYQKFETLGSVQPDEENGNLTGGYPLCATSIDDRAVADLDLTIWLEGWDHHVIDKENSHSFNLGLQFQITRL